MSDGDGRDMVSLYYDILCHFSRAVAGTLYSFLNICARLGWVGPVSTPSFGLGSPSSWLVGFAG